VDSALASLVTCLHTKKHKWTREEDQKTREEQTGHSRLVHSCMSPLYPPSHSRPPLEKTRLCQYHLINRCRYGSNCSFAHSSNELRVAPASVRKTKLCPLYPSGLCFDTFCNYAHGLEDMRSSCHYSPSTPSPREPLESTSSEQYTALLNMLSQVLNEHDKAVSILDQVSRY
jgi:hypothetical protein